MLIWIPGSARGYKAPKFQTTNSICIKLKQKVNFEIDILKRVIVAHVNDNNSMLFKYENYNQNIKIWISSLNNVGL